MSDEPKRMTSVALAAGSTHSYEEAVAALLHEFAWNPWFGQTYWPENEPRIRQVVEFASPAATSGSARDVIEVGCANGYVACLFRLLGHNVTAVDAYEDPARTAMFAKHDIRYVDSNLNAVQPLSELGARTFDIVLLGEVIEHILNNPSELLRQILRVLRPGGMLVLSTPNPSTLANAWRLASDRYVLWGTPEFLRETKMDGHGIISRGDIHYREYPAWVMQELLREVGFLPGQLRYVPAGITRSQNPAKRVLKHGLLWLGLSGVRLLAPGYVLEGRVPPAGSPS